MKQGWPESAQVKGGQVTAVRLREGAEASYYADPNRCRNCGLVIQVLTHQKVSTVRQKKFCSQRCSAIFNNHGKPSRVTFRLSARRAKAFVGFEGLTKGELMAGAKGYQSWRSRITSHARHVLKTAGVPKVCGVCGYSRHVEASHKVAVQHFGPAAKMGEINAQGNLEYLCPNHHWEHEHGIARVAQMGSEKTNPA